MRIKITYVSHLTQYLAHVFEIKLSKAPKLRLYHTCFGHSCSCLAIMLMTLAKHFTLLTGRYQFWVIYYLKKLPIGCTNQFQLMILSYDAEPLNYTNIVFSLSNLEDFRQNMCIWICIQTYTRIRTHQHGGDIFNICSGLHFECINKVQK